MICGCPAALGAAAAGQPLARLQRGAWRQEDAQHPSDGRGEEGVEKAVEGPGTSTKGYYLISENLKLGAKSCIKNARK